MANRKSLLPQGTYEQEPKPDNPFLAGLMQDVEQEEAPEKTPVQPYAASRVHRKVKFHDLYTQFTNYQHNSYFEPFDILREELEVSRTALFNEALYDLFLKHREILEECGIDVETLPAHPKRKKQR